MNTEQNLAYEAILSLLKMTSARFLPDVAMADYVRQFPYRKLPAGIPAGEKGSCYANAIRLCQEGYTYGEGYAAALDLPVPIEHAWCIDNEGNVVDNTWHTEAIYIGIPMRPDRVWTLLAESGYYGVFESLKMTWKGREDFEKLLVDPVGQAVNFE